MQSSRSNIFTDFHHPPLFFYRCAYFLILLINNVNSFFYRKKYSKKTNNKFNFALCAPTKRKRRVVPINIRQQKTASFNFFIPPYILNRMAQSTDEKVRRAAVEAIGSSFEMRATRRVLATMPIMAAIPSVERKKERLVYDMKHSSPICFSAAPACGHRFASILPSNHREEA
jgi:hypothetical protein